MSEGRGARVWLTERGLAWLIGHDVIKPDVPLADASTSRHVVDSANSSSSSIMSSSSVVGVKGAREHDRGGKMGVLGQGASKPKINPLRTPLSAAGSGNAAN